MEEVKNTDVQTAECQEPANKEGKKKKVPKKDRKEAEEIEKLRQAIGEANEKYLRLYAEFDNFRRRTSKEKADLIRTGGESVIASVLPVLDDMERAVKSMEGVAGTEAVKEGQVLILNKFREILTNQGIKEIDTTGGDFNPDLHEAITRFPAPDESLKGKIIDVVQKGYFLHDKVIRFTKVVVGE
jgi:molecular chaperone GrpE